jgi:hypothetical protein
MMVGVIPVSPIRKFCSRILLYSFSVWMAMACLILVMAKARISMGLLWE